MKLSAAMRLFLVAATLAAAGAWAQGTAAPGAAAAPVAPAAPAGSLQAERARINAERGRVAERLAAEERACHQRFAVNDCLERSRAWQRDALDDLRRQEILLNDGERRRKAADQLDRLDNKQKERAQDAASRQTQPQREPNAAPAPKGGRLPGEAAPRVIDPQQAEKHQALMQRKQERHAQQEARRAAQAAEVVEQETRHARRLREAAEHKASILERSTGKSDKAKPLPLPPPG